MDGRISLVGDYGSFGLRSVNARERRVRRLVRKYGLYFSKSRERKSISYLKRGGQYMLVDVNTNTVVLGGQYGASLKDIEASLQDVEGYSAEFFEQLAEAAKRQ